MKIYNPTGFSSSLTGSFSGSFTGNFLGAAKNSISGAFTQDSSSFASRIDDLETFEANIDSTYATDGDVTAVSNRVGTLEGKTLLSSSAQIANDISGSFTQLSSSIASTYLLNTTDTLTGDLTVTGTITAQEFHTEFVSASIIYQSGSTQFGDSADDTHIFSGSVGINVSSPSTALNVNGDLLVQDSAGTRYVRIDSPDADNSYTGRIGTTSSHDLALLSANNERIRIDSGGNVGVGTTPLSKFHIKVATNENVRFYSNPGAHIGSLNDANSAYSSLNFAASDYNFKIGTSTAASINTSGDIAFPYAATGTKQILMTPRGANTYSATAQTLKIKGQDAVTGAQAMAGGDVIIEGGDGEANTGLSIFPGDIVLKGGLDFASEAGGGGEIFMYTEDTLRLKIKSNGNVGIGTTSPQAKLDVRAGAGFIRLGSYDDNYHVKIEQGDQLNFRNAENPAVGYIQYAGPGDTLIGRNLYVQANGSGGVSGVVRIDSDGNVGIGTTSPTANLHIRSTGDVSLLLEADSDNVTEADNPTLVFAQDGGLITATLGLEGNAGTVFPTAGSNGFYISSAEEIMLGTSGAERIRIAADGNVGIGTTTPAYKLDVDSVSGARIKVATGGYNWLNLVSGFTGNISVGLNDSGGSGGLGIYQYDSTGTYVRTAINLLSDGNVGIGISPTSALHVNGGGGAGPWVKFEGGGAVYDNIALSLNDTGTSSGNTNNLVFQGASANIAKIKVTTVGNSAASGGHMDFITYSDAGSTENTPVRIASTGNVGIGTTDSLTELLYLRGPDLGSTSGDVVRHARIRGARHHLTFEEERTSNTGDWNSTSYKLQMRVDTTKHQSIQFAVGSNYAEHIDIYTGNNLFHSRFDSNRNLGIGTTVPTEKLHVQGNIRAIGGVLFDVTNTASGGDYNFLNMGYNGSWSANQNGAALIDVNDGTGTVGAYGVSWDGNKGYFVVKNLYDTNYGNSGTVVKIRPDVTYLYNVYGRTVGATNRDVYIGDGGDLGYLSSTRESKINISSITDTDWLLNLNPVQFNRRLTDDSGSYTENPANELEYGLIADEVETINSDVVFYDVDENGNKTLAGVAYRQLTAPLLKLVQQQQAKIQELENRIQALEV